MEARQHHRLAQGRHLGVEKIEFVAVPASLVNGECLGKSGYRETG